MKKVLFIAVAMLSLVFVSCNKDDERDAFVGTYVGEMTLKGTEIINGDTQTISQSSTGTFAVSKDGNSGNRVIISGVGIQMYGQTGSLNGSVSGNVLTIDGVHVSQEAYDLEGDKIALSIDLVFDPVQLVNNHISVNGTIHSLQISGPLKDELKATITIEADKQ